MKYILGVFLFVFLKLKGFCRSSFSFQPKKRNVRFSDGLNFGMWHQEYDRSYLVKHIKWGLFILNLDH